MLFSKEISSMKLKVTSQRGAGVCKELLMEWLQLSDTTFGKVLLLGTKLILKYMVQFTLEMG